MNSSGFRSPPPPSLIQTAESDDARIRIMEVRIYINFNWWLQCMSSYEAGANNAGSDAYLIIVLFIEQNADLHTKETVTARNFSVYIKYLYSVVACDFNFAVKKL